MAFALGGLISILTGLSYAKLNLEVPSNDAEYSWIIDSFTTKKDKKEKTKRYQYVEKFARIIIYSVMALGIAMNAAVAISIFDLSKPYFPSIPKFLFSFLIILIPSIVNIISAKYTSKLNIGITATSITLLVVILLGLFTGKNMKENKLLPISNNGLNLLHGIFISIFAFTGFESLPQMTEEAKKQSDIPKGMITSIGLSTLFYIVISISIIALFGVNKSALSVSPIVDAYGLSFGNKAKHIVNTIAIITMGTTLLLSTMSRSRLLKKLADRGLAPSFLSKLTETIKGSKMSLLWLFH